LLLSSQALDRLEAGEVRGFFERFMESLHGTFRIRVDDVLVNDECVIVRGRVLVLNEINSVGARAFSM
jgi:hypothetical protein